MKINESKLSLIGKARARPDQVKKVMQSVSQQGLHATYQKVSDRLDSYTPLGYSLCGEVVEVGAGMEHLAVGQRVACAGNSYALHAEYNWVPRNLCVPVPEGVAAEHAAFTTVGAIAMQGYRQSEARLGETACVIGLGLVGQLLVQILRAAGVNVVGLDPSPSGAGWPSGRARRLLPARPASRGRCWRRWPPSPTAPGPTTSSSPPAVTPTSRSRSPPSWPGTGRVVDIGKVRLDLPWTEYYAKELDVRFSRSYGPGRYDPSYEEGVDYPIGYVRWTERRNMACFLDLVAGDGWTSNRSSRRCCRSTRRSAPTSGSSAASSAASACCSATRPTGRQAGWPSRPYRAAPPVDRWSVLASSAPATTRPACSCRTCRTGPTSGWSRCDSATGLSAANAQRRFGFERCSTDHRGLLADMAVDAVVIATRHHAHAAMVCEALRAGKAVFVEKPLAVDPDQLQAILAAVGDSGNDRLMVGFNRRFAPLLVDLRGAGGPKWTSAGPLRRQRRAAGGRQLVCTG